MKAKVKATGEIIDVYISGYGKFSKPVNSEAKLEPIYKENEWSSEGYRECNLDFNDTIDWEQRRYEIAKNVSCGILANSQFNDSINHNVSIAVKYADELIKELKKK